jgi:hypothetical protein
MKTKILGVLLVWLICGYAIAELHARFSTLPKPDIYECDLMFVDDITFIHQEHLVICHYVCRDTKDIFNYNSFEDSPKGCKANLKLHRTRTNDPRKES